MKSRIVAAFLIAVAGSTAAAEEFSGTHSYTGTSQPWLPAPGTGYATLKMVGTFVPRSGPIPESRVECRGANFWTSELSEAEGVCVFGELPDRWMLRYRMTDKKLREQRRERFGRRGEWTIVGGVGRYEGISGSGTCLAKSGVVGEGGVYETMWHGEVELPE